MSARIFNYYANEINIQLKGTGAFGMGKPSLAGYLNTFDLLNQASNLIFTTERLYLPERKIERPKLIWGEFIHLALNCHGNLYTRERGYLPLAKTPIEILHQVRINDLAKLGRAEFMGKFDQGETLGTVVSKIIDVTDAKVRKKMDDENEAYMRKIEQENLQWLRDQGYELVDGTPFDLKSRRR